MPPKSGRRTGPAAVALSAWLLCLGSSAGWADIPDSTALLVDGSGARFSITVNGLPVGAPRGRALAGAAFFLDTLLHEGDNDVSIAATLAPGPGTMQLTLTAPAATGAPSGARLGHAQCGFSLPDGRTPPCPREQIYHFTIHLAKAPDFRLWHARQATPSGAAIAASLASEQAALTAAARAGDWPAVFYGHDPRRADLLAAGAGVRAQAAEMAGHMRNAASGHPGMIQSAAPPEAGDLILTSLPFNLVAVSRRDGAPILRVQVGSGQSQDPEDFGDVTDRYLDGIDQHLVTIYGFESGAWKRLR